MDGNLRKQMIFEENRKSVGLAYVLWLFLGAFGVHRFYTGNTKSGIAQLVLLISVIGWLVLVPWLLLDLLLIPGLVNERNMKTIDLINNNEPKSRSGSHRVERGPEAERIETEADRRRAAMLEDLRQTGYRKQRRNNLYR